MDISTLIENCQLCGKLPKLVGNHMQIGNSPFIIIGESPAKDGWIESKRAFYNTNGKLQASGRVLEKLLNRIGYLIGDIYFTETCKCIINDRKDLYISSKNCLPILLEELKTIPCKVILTMGLHPTQALLKTKIKRFGDVAGKQFELHIDDKDFILIPIYHTSPINPKGYVNNLPIFESVKQLCDNLN